MRETRDQLIQELTWSKLFIRAEIGILIAFAAFAFFGVVTIISAVGVFYLLIH